MKAAAVTTLPRERLLRVLERRFDQQALEQLRAEVSRLAAENERLVQHQAVLRDDLALAQRAQAQAEEDCDLWRQDALDFQLALCDRTGGQPGLDIDGHLRVVAG